MNRRKSANGKYVSTANELFERHTERGLRCWQWKGYINGKGYGFTRVGGRGSRGILAHRLSWIVNVGPIPKGMHVLHRCDNPPCVNPEHLFLGTNLDNIKDRMSKGRSGHGHGLSGNQHPNAKITDERIKQLVERRAKGERVKDLAAAYGIRKEYASKLLNGKTGRSPF